MVPSPTHSEKTELLSLANELLQAVEKLHPLEGVTSEGKGGGLRETIVLYLKGKIVPELTAATSLPLFVGVQGGTNVGKSTIFNALVGKLLSPSIVQASATKHPLVFVHERWRDILLGEGLLTIFTPLELTDPKELIVDPARTDLLYLRFHNDDRLETIAVIDSPDFDSALRTNSQVARRISILSDLTLFVTTAQKYKDNDLVEHLRILKQLKARVMVLFNMVEEEIVFETLAEDLSATVQLNQAEFSALRVPPSRTQYPEDGVRELLQEQVLGPLRECAVGDIKPLMLQRTCERLLGYVGELCRRLSGQIVLKTRLESHLTAELENAVKSYAESFRLALPEETLAAKRLIRQTELWPLLALPSEVQRTSRVLGFISLGVSRFNETVQRIILRLCRSDEGAIDDSPAAVTEYARARNEEDFEHVLLSATTVARSLEALLRTEEKTSPLARDVVQSVFPPENTARFPALVRGYFDEETGGPGVGEALLQRLDRWFGKHPYQARSLTLTANVFKVGAGLLLAYVVPPSGVFHLANWLYFAAGYFLAAYAIALTISLCVRRRRRHLQSRTKSMRQVLERSVATPFRECLDDVLRKEDVAAIEQTAGRLEKKVGVPEGNDDGETSGSDGDE